jgi:hypothetical protein
MPLVLEADGTNFIKWWADAAYAVHPDMHSQWRHEHGKGCDLWHIHPPENNKKSSTEAELVGASKITSQVMWTRYFLEAQGCTVDDSIVYQDNKSAILLEKHGKGSSSKRTRHINIRYFL